MYKIDKTDLFLKWLQHEIITYQYVGTQYNEYSQYLLLVVTVKLE